MRALFGEDLTKNAVHGSSDPDKAKNAIKIIFGDVPLDSQAAEGRELATPHNINNVITGDEVPGEDADNPPAPAEATGICCVVLVQVWEDTMNFLPEWNNLTIINLLNQNILPSFLIKLHPYMYITTARLWELLGNFESLIIMVVFSKHYSCPKKTFQ